jgi:hypothetical protein
MSYTWKHEQHSGNPSHGTEHVTQIGSGRGNSSLQKHFQK